MSKTPSPAQARRLAEIWGTNRAVKHLPGLVPTDDVLVRNGWVDPTGEDFTYPSGAVGNLYVISEAGIDALAAYFRKTRTPA